jgi:hypothetical protein
MNSGMSAAAASVGHRRGRNCGQRDALRAGETVVAAAPLRA